MCVSSLVIDEIKRIIKDSEIMKYDSLFSPSYKRLGAAADRPTGKTMRSGRPRTRTESKSWRSASEAIIFRSRYVMAASKYNCANGSELTRDIDCQDWIDQRCYGLSRPRRLARLLLPRSGPQGVGVQSYRLALQDQAHLIASPTRSNTPSLISKPHNERRGSCGIMWRFLKAFFSIY